MRHHHRCSKYGFSINFWKLPKKQICFQKSCEKPMRSSRSQMFFKIGVLKNFAILTGKHLCWSLLYIKLHAWRCFLTQVLSCEYCEIFKNTYFEEQLRWLILAILWKFSECFVKQILDTICGVAALGEVSVLW